MSWTLDLLGVVLGFAFLAKGSAWLVDGASTLGRRWGVAPFVVGLTIVAWGTSLPEVVVSVVAAAKGRPAASLGNVLGSNMANIGMVMGAAAVILPTVFSRRNLLGEGFWLLGSLGLLWGLMVDGELQRMDAMLLLAAFVAYNVHLFRGRGRRAADPPSAAPSVPKGTVRPWVLVLLGSGVIYLGAETVMWAGTRIAEGLGMGDAFLGLTILALGSSLPELFACLTSVRRGDADMSLGNVVGSNVFNTLAVTGMAGTLSPFGGGEQINLALSRDFPLCIGFTVLLLALSSLGPRKGSVGAGRLAGFLLLSCYVAYLIYISLAG
ncbi:MAG TPA: calcium/sodium antiporter [Planctomycetes bacterium]|nr:calcium/sodium antiporter [Planctomycetota bacterium]HIK60629.1 calcium/sodium antiporter [Planctomycetota bacterium]